MYIHWQCHNTNPGYSFVNYYIQVHVYIYIGNVTIPTQVIKYNKCCSRLISQSACSIHSKNHLTMAKVFLLVEAKKYLYMYMCITIICATKTVQN